MHLSFIFHRYLSNILKLRSRGTKELRVLGHICIMCDRTLCIIYCDILLYIVSLTCRRNTFSVRKVVMSVKVCSVCIMFIMYQCLFIDVMEQI